MPGSRRAGWGPRAPRASPRTEHSEPCRPLALWNDPLRVEKAWLGGTLPSAGMLCTGSQVAVATVVTFPSSPAYVRSSPSGEYATA